MKSADVIIPYIESYVQKHAWAPWGKVQVRAAALGNNAALLGAIHFSQKTQITNKPDYPYGKTANSVEAIYSRPYFCCAVIISSEIFWRVQYSPLPDFSYTQGWLGADDAHSAPIAKARSI